MPVSLSHHEMTMLFLSLAVLLFAARFLGEIARHFHQPVVLGEILAGILLGPTVFGSIAPAWQAAIFPVIGPQALVFKSFMAIAVVMFLFAAGLEVDLSSVWRQGKAVVTVSFWGLVIPFVIGVFTASLMTYWNLDAGVKDPFIFMIFLGTAFAISALPVIAKILMDLNLYRSDLGIVVISAAIMQDLIGWIIFAIILGMLGAHTTDITHTVVGTLLFVVGMLIVGRWVLDRILPWLQAHTSWPGGFIGFTLASALLCASFTEYIGIHAIFGAFIFGVALGDSRHMRERTRVTIDQFVSFFFAPLFFASIGLNVNFIANFDLKLVLLFISLATVAKVVGGGIGARFSGFNIRESLAIGFGMNARGAIEIILGLIALQVGLIDPRIFVALVTMALFTSMTSGFFMQILMRYKRQQAFNEFLSRKLFIRSLKARNSKEVIDEMSQYIHSETGLSALLVQEQVWKREQVLATGLENSVAVPHARLAQLQHPIVAVGFSHEGIDFDAPDGSHAKIILLILTPEKDHEVQLKILAAVGRTFRDAVLVEKCLTAKGFTEFLALIKSDTH